MAKFRVYGSCIGQALGIVNVLLWPIYATSRFSYLENWIILKVLACNNIENVGEAIT